MHDLTDVLTRIADEIWAPMAYVVLGLGVAFTIATRAKGPK